MATNTRNLLLPIALGAVLTLAGCETMKTMDVSKLTDVGGTAMKAMSLSDGDIAAMSDQSCAAMDQKNQIAPANSKYTTRLNQVIRAMPTTVNGKTANYRVYMTPDVNAWAMANGCIRVYSGLMDLMNDDELRGVIGHEEGHVALGHTRKAMQTAYATSAARDMAGAAGGSVAAMSQSQIGALAEKFVNAQFSQSQESEADNYSFDLLTRQKLKRDGLVTAFQKLAAMGGESGTSMLSSHPSSTDRAANMQKRIDQTP